MNEIPIESADNTLLRNPRLDADTPWKNILEIYFRDFLEFCLPELANKIDWEKGYISLDKELQKIHRESKIRGRVADKLIKVWRLDKKDAWFLIHIEVQSGRDSNLPLRMFVYHYRIFDRYQVPVINIALLADNQFKWRPDYYREEFFGCHLEMRFLTVKILDYRGQYKISSKPSNPFVMIVLAQLCVLETSADPTERLQRKICLTRQLFYCSWEKDKIIEVFKIIDWLIGLPEELKLQYHQATQKIEEEKSMAYVSTAEWVGMKKGMQQGVRQGIRQGKVEVIIQQLTRRFGQVPSKYLLDLEKADLEQLSLWSQRVLDAVNIEEIFTSE